MKTNYLFMAQTGFVALTFLCLALILAGVRQTFQKMNVPRSKANNRLFLLMAIFGGWLLIVSTLALNGFLSDFSTFPPKVPFVVLPPLISIGLLTFNPRFRNFLLHVPPQWLIYLQLFRIPVEIFLWWLFLANVLPEQMTFEGRNFDIVAGLTAPIFGWLCYGQGRYNQTLALFWNILGLVLLLNIVLIAILSLPTPLRVFMNEPSSWRVTTFPFILLPAVLVPMAYSMHFFSLRKRWLERHLPAPSGNPVN
jgi:hypothetical protein